MASIYSLYLSVELNCKTLGYFFKDSLPTGVKLWQANVTREERKTFLWNMQSFREIL